MAPNLYITAKNITAIGCLMILLSCNSGKKPRLPNSNTSKTDYKDSIKDVKEQPEAVTSFASDDPSEYDEFANYYVVIADTGSNYYPLQQKMFHLAKTCELKIDTMDRSYNPTKDLIALPEHYDDEIYAGDYYPRREVSDHLSLEYLNIYKPSSLKKTIAIVSGIYENKRSADSAFALLKVNEPTAFCMKSKIYIGCMH